jgi:HYR domain
MPRRFVALLPAGLLLAATPALADPPPPPTLAVPAVVTAEPQSETGANVAFRVSATDWKGRPVPVVCQPSSGSPFPLSTTRVSCAATDRREQTTTGSFAVTVEHLYRPREQAGVPRLRELRFAWYPATRARLYNLQLWRKTDDSWRKIASVFPARERFLLQRSWLHRDHRYRLVKGSYRWYVWPWFGSRYGPALGSNSFRVRRR